ncbi:hypothetical protein HanPSC8_Chr02g0083241 [Helianthus annuus]|nr:hypothetical protein HanPSC8_Chr02g0083241 [Helianthus annuus]
MMDNAIVHRKIVGKDEYRQHVSNDDFESSKEDCVSTVSVTEPSSVNSLHISDFCAHKLFLQQISVLKKMIPKPIMTLEEKYIRHCLELIHMSTMRENSCSVSSKVNFFPDRFSSRVVGGDGLLLFSSGDENLAISSSVKPIVGSITGSRSMINLMNSPLLRRLTASENNNFRYENPSVTEASESLCGGSSQDVEKKRIVSGDHVFRSDPMHKRLVSFSSTNSTSSSSSSSTTSSSSSAYSHGMLHCSWNNGFPRYVLSVEDQREVYTTNLIKTDSGYVYMFYSRSGKRENGIIDDEADLVGKLRVSTSFTLCPLGTEIMETRFILSATGHGHHTEGGTHTPNPMTVKKTTGLSKKVASILRGNHSYRQRTLSKFDGSVAQQDGLLPSNEDGNLFPANLELAAIIVKDHIPCKKVEQVGGWGLKFLKEQKAAAAPVTQSAPCEACRHDSDRHSISMDVVVPAGFHGGPRTKNGGPSGLVERWRSGGACDCGGWDIGCPLTLLSSGPNNKDGLYQDGVFGKSNRFELFTQGSVAAIEVTNVHDGLYYIHYQSTLSALQSLSIAVAIIHSHSPTLKPKLLYRNT